MILLSLFLVMASGAHAQAVTITLGDEFEVERYAVALRPDLATTAVPGTETIAVRVTSDQVTQLALGANALRISEATLNAAPAQVTSNKDTVVFASRQPLRGYGDRQAMRVSKPVR